MLAGHQHREFSIVFSKFFVLCAGSMVLVGENLKELDRLADTS
jgi:hypothetical protein